MSWFNYKPSTSSIPEAELREARRQKLEADRQKGLQDRTKRQQQLQSALQAQQEADQALKDLLNLQGYSKC